jgi:hypothetical protein
VLLLVTKCAGFAGRNSGVEGDNEVTQIQQPSLRGAFACGLTIIIVAVNGAAWPESYEQPPAFSASQVLPRDLLQSPNYRVDDRVGLENFQYAFSVHTKWGTFPIKGADLLRLRAREMAATAKLEEVGGAETAVESAGRTALKPVETAKDLITAPGQTIGDTFRGVGHIFGRAKAAMSATDPHKEGVIASVTGGSSARRKLAFDLGVDPNTSFPPLSDQLKRLATASAFGETGANVGLSFVAGPAGIAISASGTSNALREALRDKTAAELEKDGRQTLTAMGVSHSTMDVFYDNAMLTPTDKAIIVVALQSLAGASGREIFVASAARAHSIEMGYFYRQQAELIAAYCKRVAPVRSFLRLGGAPMLQTTQGTVSLLPVDYLIWTPPLAELIAGANRDRKGRGRAEFWITGKASQTATAKLAELGWKVMPKAAVRLRQ